MAHSGAMVSLAGLAVMQLPATVPRLRICGAPTSQQARARGKACATASDVPTTWLCVTSAPRVSVPFLRSNAVQLGDARNVHDNLLLADAALDLQDQIGAAHDEPARVAVLGKEFQRLSDGARGMIGVPHCLPRLLTKDER